MSNFKAPLRTIQSNFRTGEIDPMFAMRVDAQAYPHAAKTLNNCLIHNTGPVSRRPGTTMLAQLNNKARLIPFEFDSDEKYVCAFTNARVDIYDPAGALVHTLTGQPWGVSQLWEMTFVQKGDVMIIAHISFRMRRLVRTSAVDFSITSLQFDTDSGTSVLNQPYTKYLGNNDKLAISNVARGSGRILTSTAAMFSPAWVGERVRIYNKEIQITAYTDPNTVTATVHQTVEADLGIAPMRFTKGSDIIEVTHPFHGLDTGAGIKITGSNAFGNLLPEDIDVASVAITVIDSDRYWYHGGVVCTSSGDGGGGSITASTINFTRNWTEPVWSDRRGWPGAICLHENRIWLGGSLTVPTFLAGSAVGQYYDFNVRDGLDDESVQGTISATSRIIHLVSAKELQIFTELGEYLAETAEGQPITPSSFKVVQMSAYGSSWTFRPQTFDGTTLFAQKSGRNVREVVFDTSSEIRVANSISVIASHIINGPKDLACLLGTPTRAEMYALMVNGTAPQGGTIAVFHSIRSEQLAAWTHWTAGTGGIFDSVCVIGTKVYFSVLRHGGYALELLELDRTDTWLDGAVRLTNPTPKTTWDLGTWFGGVVVDVMSDGNWLGRFTTNASSVLTLPDPVDNIVAGYPYDVTIVPMSPDRELTDGTMTGEIRRIVSANIHFHQSVSAEVKGLEVIRSPTQSLTSQPPKFTGKRKMRFLGYGTDPDITISQALTGTGPLTVAGLTFEVSI